MKLMIRIRVVRLFVIVLIAISAPTRATPAFDNGVLCAEWGAVESHWLKSDWYQYLKVNDDFSGVFSYSFGEEPITLRFSPGDVMHEDGFVVIRLNRPGGSPFRLVLAGWRMASGEGLVTGTLFMYQEELGREYLFNSIPVRLEWLVPTRLKQDAVPTIQDLKKGLGRQ